MNASHLPLITAYEQMGIYCIYIYTSVMVLASFLCCFGCSVLCDGSRQHHHNFGDNIMISGKLIMSRYVQNQ